MFCKSCGTPLKEGAKFCPACGQAVVQALFQPEPAAGKPAEPGLKGNVPDIQSPVISQPVMIHGDQPGAIINRAAPFLLAFLILFTIPALVYWFFSFTQTPFWPDYGIVHIFLQILYLAGYVFGIIFCVKLRDAARNASMAALVLFAVNALRQAYYLLGVLKQ
jgi:hypothetical protein